MKFIKIFLKNLVILLIILVVLVGVNRRYLGGFTQFDVQEKNIGEQTIAYVSFVGEYGKVGPSMNKVYDVLSGAGILSATGIGIYYDDPTVVSGSDLRSDVGAVIDPQEVIKIEKNSEIHITTLPAGNKMVVEFPLKNALSYMIGPMKVYPIMAKYMQEKGYTNEVPTVELYDMVSKKIYYIVEIAK